MYEPNNIHRYDLENLKWRFNYGKFQCKGNPKINYFYSHCFFSRAVGTVYTLKEITGWYQFLPKPSWTPPNWAFGPIWSILYVLMGISLFLVWREGLNQKKVQIGILVFAVQLAINVIWSLVFFGTHNIFGGLVLVLILWISILINIVVFYRISKPAGLDTDPVPHLGQYSILLKLQCIRC